MTPGALVLVVALGSRPATSEDVAPPSAPAAVEDVPTLRIGTPVVLILLDGQRLDGTFTGFEGQAVRLSGPRGVEPIPVVLVSAFEVAGRSWTPAAFLEGARHAADALPALAAPPPVVPLVTSFLWAGAGYLTLGDTRTFVGYAALDAIFVGAGTVFALQHQWGALAPVVALDLLLRGWSGGASAREASRRRALRQVHAATTTAPTPAAPGQTPADLDR